MPTKEYFVTFYREKRKVASGRIKSKSQDDAILDADFKMLINHPVFVYDEITAEEI